jgi:hypothetical protein
MSPLRERMIVSAQRTAPAKRRGCPVPIPGWRNEAVKAAEQLGGE